MLWNKAGPVTNDASEIAWCEIVQVMLDLLERVDHPIIDIQKRHVTAKAASQ